MLKAPSAHETLGGNISPGAFSAANPTQRFMYCTYVYIFIYWIYYAHSLYLRHVVFNTQEALNNLSKDKETMKEVIDILISTVYHSRD